MNTSDVLETKLMAIQIQQSKKRKKNQSYKKDFKIQNQEASLWNQPIIFSFSKNKNYFSINTFFVIVCNITLIWTHLYGIIGACMMTTPFGHIFTFSYISLHPTPPN